MKTTQLIRRRSILGYLVGCYITTESTMFDNRVNFHWVFMKLIPGSSMWQMYCKK